MADSRWEESRPATSDVQINSADAVLASLARDALTEKTRSRRWRIFFRFLFAGLLLAFILVPLIANFSKLSSPGRHTAVVDISGIIADGAAANAGYITDSLEAAFKHKQTAGVILRINSPGGSPVQSGIIFDEILRLRSEHPDTPVYAVITDVCASGGYYIAAAADRIYADKASVVGSIGVRMDSFGFVDTLEKLGVERRLITAGENKALLDPFLPENPEHRAHLESVLGVIHQQFIDAVKRGRGERLQGGDELFSGLFWSGEEAVGLGLVDELASERKVASDVVGVKRRVDFTYREGLADKLIGRISQRLSLEILSRLNSPVSW